jgi:hypothetical protein
MLRVQVKSTSRRDRSNRNDRYSLLCASGCCQKTAYTGADIDILAVYIEPNDAWYIIPISEVTGTRLNLYPHKTGAKNKYEKWLNRWDMF